MSDLPIAGRYAAGVDSAEVRATEAERSPETPAALDAAPPATVPVGWETEAEWDLETRMFHAGRDGVPADVRTVIRDLWHQYCLAADPNGPVQGPLRAEIAALKATHQRTLEALREALERAAPYLLDAVNEQNEKIKTLAGYPKLIARQEAYKADVEADRAFIDATLARIKEAT